MANNRMFIKCDVCGSEKMIVKYYPSSGWYFECFQESGRLGSVKTQDTVNRQRIRAFNDWLDKHLHGVQNGIGPTHFSLTFETTADED